MPDSPRFALADARRIVVKIGSALLAQGGPRYFSAIARQIQQVREGGRDVLLVSSGAIALGLPVLGLKRRPHQLGQLQAAAAAGQPQLVQQWARSLDKLQIPSAQVLLTHADLGDRERFINARHAIEALLKAGVLPIANENDTVATEEIRVGDNDQLSAYLATLVGADLLVLLTTVDGLHTANPEKDPDAERISVVTDLRQVSHLAEGAGNSGLGVGGMATKMTAARVAISSGIPVVIAQGTSRRILQRILAGADTGTFIVPSERLKSRKHWIGFTTRVRGTLVVDEGAARTLREHPGRSLLPSGLVEVEGRFDRGDTVEIKGPDGAVAKGLAAYSSDEIEKLIGCKSSQIEAILGYVDTTCVVHCDDMVRI